MTPYYQTSDGTIYKGDCNEVMRSFPDNHFACIVTDPPYELGFMGKKWDSSGVAFQIDTWKNALRVAKPGAFLLAFGGTRTHHRLMCAIEDAGWEIRDCMMWLFGSGFPKSLDISKAIDKAAGVTREKIMVPTKRGNLPEQAGRIALGATGMTDISTPATPEAQEWNGYGTSLKPAYEPIIVAMKPLESTFAENALNHGVAGLNIDACRIGMETVGARASNKDGIAKRNLAFGMKEFEGKPSQGRFPANIILTHHPECEMVGVKKVKVPKHRDGYLIEKENFGGTRTKKPLGKNDHSNEDGTETVEEWNCHPDCPVGILDEQSGERKAGGKVKGNEPSKTGQNDIYGHWDRVENFPHNDTGTASRFFKCCPQDDVCFLCDLTFMKGKKEGDPSCQKFAKSVNSVKKSFGNIKATIENTAPKNAQDLQAEQLAQRVKSVENLCDLCAIVIAQSIVVMQHGQDPAQLHGWDFINEPKKPILLRCLVSFVDLLGNIDTIPTTENLSLFFGFVRDAIRNNIPTNETGNGQGQISRLKYCAKASRSERGKGNKHPTVKPLSLIKYLVELIAPPKDALILDMFFGSGSLGVICERLGIKYVGIDLDVQYAIPRIEKETQQRKMFN